MSCSRQPEAVDVSLLVALSVDDPFGEHRAAVEEWHVGIGKLRTLANAPALVE
jgi:hypothetical protein